MAEEWGPWIKHDGGPCPVSRGLWVDTFDANGEREEGFAYYFCETNDMSDCWINDGDTFGTHIIRYRIRKPRGLTTLEEILADLPEKVDA